MAKIYANLIEGKVINPKTGLEYAIDDVPAKLQEAVKEILGEV